MACESKYGDAIDINCTTCGLNFCFACTKSAHKPMDCDLLQKWLDRISQGDEDTSNWIKLNTKQCPKCKASIQKNQGCMHMTCRNCKYEFCWLCLGDYKKHSAETGRGLCNSYQDVVAAGRGASEKELTNAAQIERELKRLEFYSDRYNQHQGSIQFAVKQLESVKNQVDFVASANPKYSPNDFQFIIDIAGLVVAARRSLSYTYAIRYYLSGPNRQAFFDFQQGELEASLEKLNARNEENWLNYLDNEGDYTYHLGERFFVFKQQIVTLRETLERHFNTIMLSIQNGLPEVQEEVKVEVDFMFSDKPGDEWTCRVCQIKNPTTAQNCNTCRSARPIFKPVQPKPKPVEIGG